MVRPAVLPLYALPACSAWGLHLQEQDVRQIFDPFGPIDYVTMQKELAGGRQSSVAFVQYASLQLIP